MNTWQDMTPLAFNTKIRTATKQQQRFAESARDTLFPELLPEVKPQRDMPPAARVLDGQGELDLTGPAEDGTPKETSPREADFGEADSGRVWDAGRKAQGFRSQAHLDAFYAYADHTEGCPECQQPGPAMWLEGSASWQPTNAICPEGKRLRAVSDAGGA